MSHSYAYYACSNCGQVVAHTMRGEPLHMHARSAKCERIGKLLRESKVIVNKDGTMDIPMNSPVADAFFNHMLKKSSR